MAHDVTFGQKAADFAAARIGSWAFLILFNLALFSWIGFNTWLGIHAIDPFPFILSNLMLSWLAGVQAPLIMIAQNRQEQVQRETLETILLLSRATEMMLKDQKAELAYIAAEVAKDDE